MPGIDFSLEHIGLAARNPAALKDWYVSMLGGCVLLDLPTAFFVQIPGGVVIEIYTAAADAPASENSQRGLRHLALRVSALESAIGSLRERGVVFDQEIKPGGGGGRIIFFRDAEGNLLHLVERPPGGPLNPSHVSR